MSESQRARDGRLTGDPVRRTHQPSHRNSLTSHLEPPRLDRLVPSAQAQAVEPYKAPDTRILYRAVDGTNPFTLCTNPSPTMTSLALQVLPLFGKVLDGAIAVVQTLTGKKKTAAVDHSWQPPTPTDRRSPCPMLNALANHGYLPRDGKDVSLADLVTGFKESINLAPEATFLVTVKALQASSTGNFLTLHLDDLNKHNGMPPPLFLCQTEDQHAPSHRTRRLPHPRRLPLGRQPHLPTRALRLVPRPPRQPPDHLDPGRRLGPARAAGRGARRQPRVQHEPREHAL